MPIVIDGLVLVQVRCTTLACSEWSCEPEYRIVSMTPSADQVSESNSSTNWRKATDAPLRKKSAPNLVAAVVVALAPAGTGCRFSNRIKLSAKRPKLD